MDILMPQLGETVSEGTIAVWHKKEGDTVEVDVFLEGRLEALRGYQLHVGVSGGTRSSASSSGPSAPP